MGFIFGNGKMLRDVDDHELLATCYRCGHKFKIKYMREVGYNVYVCDGCRTKAIEKKGGK